MPFDPYDAALNAIERAGGLLAASRIRGVPKEHRLPASVRADMRCLSVVMAVAALDTYIHRLIVERVTLHESLPGALAKLDLPFHHVLAWADSAKEAARRKPFKNRPLTVVKSQLRERLLRETFQSFDDVGRGMAMAGVGVGAKGKKWDLIGKKLDPPMRASEIRERLNGIIMRRNQIVHEGDYRRLDRPQNARRNPMTTAQARSDILFIADLIDAIHAVI